MTDKITPAVVAGTNEKLKGGLRASYAIRDALVAENPSQLADLDTYAPFSSGIVPEGMLDVDVTSNDDYVAPWKLAQISGDTVDANVVVEFAKSQYVNAALIQRLDNSAQNVNDLLVARAAVKASSDTGNA